MSNTSRPLLGVFLTTLFLASGASAATCPTDGSGYDYSETVTGDTRTITYTACPNHAWKAINPNKAQYDTTQTIRIPAYPKIQNEGVTGVSTTSKRTMDLTAKGGVVGIFFSAAALYSPYGGGKYGQVVGFDNSATNAEGDTFDSWWGPLLFPSPCPESQFPVLATNRVMALTLINVDAIRAKVRTPTTATPRPPASSSSSARRLTRIRLRLAGRATASLFMAPTARAGSR